MEHKKMTTDTPRTETYVLNPHPQAVPAEFARELERELNASQAEVARLRTENVCLQELIQEFYEWSRRDYPTEAEVREIMNRYHDLLNK
jgi:hypothetical protein